MAKLPLVQIVDGLVEFPQQFQALGRDAGLDDAPVILLPLPRNPGMFFHAVEQPRDVRVTGNHAVGNPAAKQSVRFRAAKDAQNIVLCCGESRRLDQLLRFLRERVGNSEDGDEDLVLRRGNGGRSKSHGGNVVVITTIVKRDIPKPSCPITGRQPHKSRFRNRPQMNLTDEALRPLQSHHGHGMRHVVCRKNFRWILGTPA